MICPSCQADVPGTPKFCNKCGAPFAVATASAASAPAATPTKVCPQCGTVNAAAARFCKKDGYNFAAAAPLKPQTPPPAAPAATPRPQPAPASAAPAQASIPGSMACPTCGTLNPPNAKFCKKDGTALGSAAAAPAAPRAPIAPPAARPAAPKVSTPIELALAPDLEPALEPEEVAAVPRAQAISQPIEAKPMAEERRVQMAPPPAAERRAPRPEPREPEVDHRKKRSPFALIAIVLGILLGRKRGRRCSLLEGRDRQSPGERRRSDQRCGPRSGFRCASRSTFPRTGSRASAAVSPAR